MYRLAEMDFSDRLGVVVGELVPDEMDRKEETLKDPQRATSQPPT